MRPILYSVVVIISCGLNVAVSVSVLNRRTRKRITFILTLWHFFLAIGILLRYYLIVRALAATCEAQSLTGQK